MALLLFGSLCGASLSGATVGGGLRAWRTRELRCFDPLGEDERE